MNHSNEHLLLLELLDVRLNQGLKVSALLVYFQVHVQFSDQLALEADVVLDQVVHNQGLQFLLLLHEVVHDCELKEILENSVVVQIEQRVLVRKALHQDVLFEHQDQGLAQFLRLHFLSELSMEEVVVNQGVFLNYFGHLDYLGVLKIEH